MTLERVLEPEVMDSLREAQDYDSMDHSEVNRRFVEELLAFVNEETFDERVEFLDLGTGTARIPVELCVQRGDARVVAVDLSTHMLDVAQYNLEIMGVTERVLLEHVDAKRLPYADGRFQGVMSNSIVHHIPEPAAVLAEAVRVLAPGGWIFFRDLMRPNDDQQVEFLVRTYAGNENEFQQKMFEDSLRAALDLSEIRALVDKLGFDPNTVEASSDRHWTWAARR